jgi:hypothetical protein
LRDSGTKRASGPRKRPGGWCRPSTAPAIPASCVAQSAADALQYGELTDAKVPAVTGGGLVEELRGGGRVPGRPYDADAHDAPSSLSKMTVTLVNTTAICRTEMRSGPLMSPRRIARPNLATW